MPIMTPEQEEAHRARGLAFSKALALELIQTEDVTGMSCSSHGGSWFDLEFLHADGSKTRKHLSGEVGRPLINKYLHILEPHEDTHTQPA